MNYIGELELLCNTFKKSRISVKSVTKETQLKDLFDDSFLHIFGEKPIELLRRHIDKTKPETVYRLKTAYMLAYIFFDLSQTPQKNTLIIGPYLPIPHGELKIFEIGEKYNVPPNRLKLLESYYSNIPYISENSRLFTLLDAFCERIWQGNTFHFTEINDRQETEMSSSPVLNKTDSDSLLFKMKLMEGRYEAENELMHAVSRGRINQATSVLSDFESMPFEKRLDDSLRDLKNYSIIMNTLLRKAAEQGGVHPIHINEISSYFAVKIEQLHSVNSVRSMMSEMYRSYCILVRKHTMKTYSSPVRKAIMMIDADLSADVSLKTLADAQNINASYLSTVFRKETGKTVTQYITEERMSLAAHLLETTNLQIQTIALHCGILDVQYFSKLFKKNKGKSPKEYREKTGSRHD